MLTFVWLTSLTASILSIRLALLIRAGLAPWTVYQSWNWMIVGLLSVLGHAFVSLPVLHAPAAIQTAAAYFAATMLLTPLVTTLGARRPGISPWHWFVVLPMVAVLQWPALSQLSGSHWRTPLELSAPASMGVIVVLIMSAGTMLGTRVAGFAILYSMGILLILLPVMVGDASNSAIDAGGAVLVFAALVAVRRNLATATYRLQEASTNSQRIAEIWELFRSLYGIAWTRRVQDRVNQFASAEKWSVLLATDGFERPDQILPSDEELDQPRNAFIWVLARFADKAWLESVLNPHNPNLPTDRSN